MKILKTILMAWSLLFLLNTSVLAEEYKPKWCEAEKLSEVETLICEDGTLRSADALMDQLYKELMSYKGKEGHEGMWYREVKSDQIDWLAKRNNAKNRVEVLDAYMSRNNELYSFLKDRIGE